MPKLLYARCQSRTSSICIKRLVVSPSSSAELWLFIFADFRGFHLLISSGLRSPLFLQIIVTGNFFLDSPYPRDEMDGTTMSFFPRLFSTTSSSYVFSLEGSSTLAWMMGIVILLCGNDAMDTIIVQISSFSLQYRRGCLFRCTETQVENRKDRRKAEAW